MDAVQPVDATQLAAVFGEETTGCASRASVLSHVSVYLDPSSERGPGRIQVPASGHNLRLDLLVAARSHAVVERISARVLARKPLHPDGVAVQSQPQQRGIFLADDLEVAHRRAMDAYVPMELPHLEVLLDFMPVLVRPALHADGTLVRPLPDLPLQVGGACFAHIVLAPVTADRDHVFWELELTIRCDGSGKTFTWDFSVTAETTFRTFHPGGHQEVTPVQLLAPHWHLQCDVA